MTIDAAELAPSVTWGTSPGMVTRVDAMVPSVEDARSEADRKSYARALEYMDLKPGVRIEEIAIDRVFIGSCTNARIERPARRRSSRQGTSCQRQPYARWWCPARSL